MLQKGISAEVGLFDALIAKLANHFGFRGNGGMVGSGHPTGVFALHSGSADQHVLDGVVEHVAHVQHPGDVGGGNHNGVGLAVVGHASEGFGVFPGLGPAVLNGGGIVL